MADVLGQVIAESRAGEAVAIPSVCSAHPEVLAASLRLAERLDRAVVIEATSNQVNQDGGYTGMRPADFIGFVRGLADGMGVARERVLFGGDHLGPQAWRKLPAEAAMAKAHVMVADYVAAGFTKVHLDCSEGCAGEPAQLPDAVTVPRAAELARTAVGVRADLLFVVGTEVPPPGGARHDEGGDIPPTKASAARETLDAHMAAFEGIGRIGGLVVQPGVEFSPMQVHHLPLARDPGLKEAVAHHPGVVLEAHSTDYQRPAAFVRLAELGFAFQKVGPALTFAWREAIYALDWLSEAAGWGASIVRPAMERVMVADPGYWQGHYHGADLEMQRHFGLADRIRYYWPQAEAQAAVAALRERLTGRALPDALLWQAFPQDVLDRAEAIGGDRVTALAHARVEAALAPYFLGAGQ